MWFGCSASSVVQLSQTGSFSDKSIVQNAVGACEVKTVRIGQWGSASCESRRDFT